MNVENQPLKLHTINLLGSGSADLGALFCGQIYTPQTEPLALCAHSFLQMCRIVEGNGVHVVFDQAIPCKAGDVFIVPPNTPHGFFFAEDGEGMAVNQLLFDAAEWFDGELAQVSSPRYCYEVLGDRAAIGYAMLNDSMQREFDGLLDRIECELAEKRQSWQDAVRAYLTQLLISVGRYINCSIKNDTPVSSKEWNLVLSIMRMAKENYGDCGFTLESVSSSVFVSVPQLSKIFKGLTGQLFSEYLRDIRIDNACRLLRETDMNVDEIVEKCGLRDIPSFYHNFNVRMRMTPRQYRQKHHQEKNLNKNKNGEKLMSIFNEISENLQKGKAKIVKELVQKALDEGANPEQILNEGLLAGMNVVGEKFKNNEVYVPEVLVSARAMNMGAQILKPVLAEAGVQATGKVCIGTVQGDLHDIGKNLVKMMMEGKGLEVIDLGTDVAPETFIKTAVEQDCQVICCSALLTTTMNVMEEVVKAADAAGIPGKVKIMIGGAPVNQEFCDKIGADCYTVDAASAADAAAAFCKA